MVPEKNSLAEPDSKLMHPAVFPRRKKGKKGRAFLCSSFWNRLCCFLCSVCFIPLKEKLWWGEEEIASSLENNKVCQGKDMSHEIQGQKKSVSAMSWETRRQEGEGRRRQNVGIKRQHRELIVAWCWGVWNHRWTWGDFSKTLKFCVLS